MTGNRERSRIGVLAPLAGMLITTAAAAQDFNLRAVDNRPSGFIDRVNKNSVETAAKFHEVAMILRLSTEHENAGKPPPWGLSLDLSYRSRACPGRDPGPASRSGMDTGFRRYYTTPHANLSRRSSTGKYFHAVARALMKIKDVLFLLSVIVAAVVGFAHSQEIVNKAEREGGRG